MVPVVALCRICTYVCRRCWVLWCLVDGIVWCTEYHFARLQSLKQ